MKTEITKISRIVGIAAVIILFVSAYLPWAKIFENGVYQAVITGMNTIGTGYKPAAIGLIFSVLYLLTNFYHRLWVKVAGVFFGVIIFAWTLKNFVYLPPNASQLYSPEQFTQFTSEKAFGIYISLVASFLILVAALTPYFPEKYRRD